MGLIELIMGFIFADSIAGDITRRKIKRQERLIAKQYNLPEPRYARTPYTLLGSRTILYILLVIIGFCLPWIIGIWLLSVI